MFNVTFVTYSGMPIPIAEHVDREQAKAAVRRRLKRAKRNGQPISKVGNGKWEIETPENAFMIGDDDGFLIVRRAR